MGVFDGLPCTDSDIFEVAIGDFATLTARSERVAYGEDGTIPTGSFVLTSAFPFQTQGVQAGHVCVIDKYTVPKAGGTASITANDVLPIASVSGSTVTLERLGYGSGQGAYPRGAGTGTGNITFYVPSLLAQIITATADVRRRLGLTAASTLVNPTDLRLVTILVVLRGLYFAQYRQTTEDTWKDKMGVLDDEIADLYLSLDRSYGALTPAGARSLVGPMNVDPCWRIPSDGMGGPFGSRWIPGTY